MHILYFLFLVHVSDYARVCVVVCISYVCIHFLFVGI